MQRPTKAFPFDSAFDFSFRPLTYWPVRDHPDIDQAVPIASIELETLPAQLIQVLASRDENGSVRYRIEDEFETEWKLARDHSEEPLTLSELIDLIDTAEAEGVIGLTDGLRDLNLEDADPEDVFRFVWVTSRVYPTIEDYYRRRGWAWLENRSPETAERLAAERDEA
jgi:hypothetical protein